MIKLREKGFTLVEIMIVVAIIAILSAIAIPNFMAARSKSRANACKANLRQIESGVEQWAMDNSKVNGNTCTFSADLVPTYIKKTPQCPSSTSATYEDTADLVVNQFKVGGTPGCSIGATSAAGGYPHILY